MSPIGSRCVALPKIAGQFVTWYLVVTLTLVVVVPVQLSHGAQEEQTTASVNREKRDAQLLTPTAQSWEDTESDDINTILQQYEDTHAGNDIRMYYPSTPSPENVNCHVEIPMTRRIGGRCVNIRSFVGCQAGIHLEYNPECTSVLGLSTDPSSQTRNLFGRRSNNPFARRRNRYRPRN